MKVDILSYRDWAGGLFSQVAVFCRRHAIELHNHEKLEDHCSDADLTFLIGWSEMVPLEASTNGLWLVLHPSQLPFYKGGSPIQHQIIDGQPIGAISIFKLDKDYPEVDSGPLYAEQPLLDLNGELDEVLTRIVIHGSQLVEHVIRDFLANALVFTPQLDGGFALKRRRPEESEITLDEIKKKPAKYLYDKIRALQDPYPNAFISCGDGEKLYITRAHL